MLDNVWKVSNYVYDRRLTLKEAVGVCTASSLVGKASVVTCSVNVLSTAIVKLFQDK